MVQETVWRELLHFHRDSIRRVAWTLTLTCTQVWDLNRLLSGSDDALKRAYALPKRQQYRLAELLDPDTFTHYEFFLTKGYLAKKIWREASEEDIMKSFAIRWKILNFSWQLHAFWSSLDRGKETEIYWQVSDWDVLDSLVRFCRTGMVLSMTAMFNAHSLSRVSCA